MKRLQRSATADLAHPRKSMLLRSVLCAGILGTVACADGVQGPASPSANPGRSAAGGAAAGGGGAGIQAGSGSTSASNERHGAFHLTKECSEYTGLPGSFCTVTGSNVEAIETGSRIIYAVSPGPATLDTDVVLDLPGPGNNKAFGHCILVLATGTGECTFSGGTGKFTWFQARADVSYLGGPDWQWEGSYSFRPHD